MFEASKPLGFRVRVQHDHKLQKRQKDKSETAQQEIVLSLGVTDRRHFCIHGNAKHDGREYCSDPEGYARGNSNTVNPKTAPRKNHQGFRGRKHGRDEILQTALE